MKELPGFHLSSHRLETEPPAGVICREVEQHAPCERLDRFDIDCATLQ
jgi:hypothetical protein